MSNGNYTGLETSLSPYAGPYVSEMLGRGAALANLPYTAYQGPLTAGPSSLQSQAFQGLASLGMPQASAAGSFSSDNVVQQYMTPYLQSVLQPQYDAAIRDAEMAQQALQSQYSRAGAFGGGRQAVAEAELGRGLLDRLAGITGQGYQQAYTDAQNMFGRDRDYGLQALRAQQVGGDTQRQIDQQGILADIAQFEQERDFPYKQTQYMQSLLQGLPISTQAYQYSEPSTFNTALGSAGGVLQLFEQLGFMGDKT
jgi:hypothetical protein